MTEYFDGLVEARGQVVPEGQLKLSTELLKSLTDCLAADASDLFSKVIKEPVDNHHVTVRLQDRDLPHDVQPEC